MFGHDFQPIIPLGVSWTRARVGKKRARKARSGSDLERLAFLEGLEFGELCDEVLSEVEHAELGQFLDALHARDEVV
eukprot:2908671-Rhodomonas_salina.3